MICFKDRAFCIDPKCNNECGRKLTEELHQEAIRWWGSEDYPISVITCPGSDYTTIM